MPSNVNENIYVDGVAVDKAALNANLLVVKNELTALQNGSGLESPAAGVAIANLINTFIGNTSWQSGGGVTSVAGETGPIISTAQIATALDALLGGADWRGPDLSHSGFSNAVSVYNPAADDGQRALMNVSTNDVNLVLPDVNTVPNGQPLWVRANSNNFQASISAQVSGQLRSRNGNPSHNFQADQIFLGFSQDSQEASVAEIWRRGGVWQVTGLIRDTADDDIQLSKRYRPGGTKNGVFTFVAADENRWIDWTGNSAANTGTISAAVLREGAVIEGERNSGFSGDIVLSGLNTTDSLTIAAGSRFSITRVPNSTRVRVGQN